MSLNKSKTFIVILAFERRGETWQEANTKQTKQAKGKHHLTPKLVKLIIIRTLINHEFLDINRINESNEENVTLW